MNKIIRILSTSDLHGMVYPYNYADMTSCNHGLARLRTMIRELRDENTVVLDNGDTLEGSPLTFYHYLNNPDEQNKIAECMRKTGYDYVNVGNHDFNYGYGKLREFIEGTGAVCLTSNVLYKGKPMGMPYDIKEIAGKKIAFFGITTHLVPNWEKPENITDMEFIDAFELARETVRTIREKENPDYIVCLYHGGLERDPVTGILGEKDCGENQGYRMIKEIEGLNVLICGHQHRIYCGTLDKVAFTEPGYTGAYLSCIEINTETGEITPQLLPADHEPAADIMRITDAEEQETQKWLDTALGHTEMDLKVHSEFDCRFNKSQLATFINRVQIDLTGADISGTRIFFTAPGFAGDITMRDLISTYMFPNTLVVKKADGRTIREYLEKCAEFWSIENGKVIINPLFDFPNVQYHNYDMLDGVEYVMDIRKPVGQRIISLTRNGKEVKEDDVFTLVINNYRASGGGNFDMIAAAETLREILTSSVDVIAEYIMKHKNIDFEPVNNITILP